MAAAGSKKAKEEEKAADKIELKQQCERELKAWIKLVKKPKFGKDLALQNEAALVCRGIVIKMQAFRAEAGDDEEFFKMASAIVRDFGAQFNKQVIDLKVSVDPIGELLDEVSRRAMPLVRELCRK